MLSVVRYGVHPVHFIVSVLSTVVYLRCRQCCRLRDETWS